MRAGFAEIEITPPIGTKKIGWIKDITSEYLLDPLFARIAVFESGEERIGFVQLDTLSVRWTQVNDLRRRVQQEYGFPGEHVMVAATHNHAGPAVASTGVVPRDEAYVESLTQKCVRAFGEALANACEAEVGFHRVFEFAVSRNRRVVMRDGTVKTHGTFKDPNALCFEGPIDPEVAVLAARKPGASGGQAAPSGGQAAPSGGQAGGELLGVIINFACHPTHHGGGTALSAGYPGVLARDMKGRGCPVTLFLNGASGNLHTADPATGKDMGMEEAGRRLADDATRALAGMKFESSLPLGAASTAVQLPYRAVTDNEIRGAVRGAQRFVDPKLYDQIMPSVLQRIAERKVQPAEVQALFMGDVAFVGIPAEYFVEHGLRIKEQTHPRHTLVVGHANGMVGYVPTRAAFARGGYETTFTMSSRLAPEAGDMLADAAIALICNGASHRGFTLKASP